MSEKSKGKTSCLELVSIILQQYIGLNTQYGRDLADYLKDQIVIDKEEKTTIRKLLKENDVTAAVRKAVEIVSASEKGLHSLVAAFKDQELSESFDEKIPPLVEALLLKPDVDDSIAWVVKSWTELSAHEAELKQIIGEIWPGHACLVKDIPWPLQFIHFCATENDIEEPLNTFVNEAKNLISIQTVQHATRKEGEAQQSPDVVLTAVVEGAGDEEPLSFVFIDENQVEEAEEDGKSQFDSQTLQQPRSSNDQDLQEQLAAMGLVEEHNQQKTPEEQEKLASEDHPSGSYKGSTQTDGDEVEETENPRSVTSESSAATDCKDGTHSDISDNRDQVINADEGDRISYVSDPIDSSTTGDICQQSQEQGSIQMGDVGEDKETEDPQSFASESSAATDSREGAHGDILQNENKGSLQTDDDDEAEESKIPQSESSTAIDGSDGTHNEKQGALTQERGSSADSTPAASEDEDDYASSVFLNYDEKIEAHRQELVPLVELAWPKDHSLVENWPKTLNTKLGSDEENQDKIVAFARTMQHILHNVEEKGLPDEIVQPPTPKKTNQWMLTIDDHKLQDTKDVLPHLVKLAWPEIDVNSSDWHIDVKNKAKKDKRMAARFVCVAKMLLYQEHKDGTHDPRPPIVSSDKQCTSNRLAPDAAGAENLASNEEWEASQWTTQPGDLRQSLDEEEIHRMNDARNRIEFRVHIPHPLAEGDTVYLELNSYTYLMNRSRNATRRVNNIHECIISLPPSEVDMRYRYIVKNQQGIFWEHLPGKEVLRIFHYVAREKNILYDVAIFTPKLTSKSQWGKIIDEHIGYHLPLITGSKETSYKSDIYTWMEQIKRGWVIGQTTHCCDTKAFEKFLMIWLESSPPNDAETRVICTLGVTLALYRLSHAIQSKDLVSMVFQSLQVENLDGSALGQLYKRICHEFESIADRHQPLNDVSRSVLKVIKNMPSMRSTDRIMALPLYWMVSGQDGATNKWSMPSDITDKEMVDMKKVMSEPSEQKKLKEIVESVAKVASRHPQIVNVYLYFLTSPSLIDLILDKSPICNMFGIDLIFSQMLPLLVHLKCMSSAGKKAEKLKPGSGSQMAAYGHKILDTKNYLIAHFNALACTSGSKSQDLEAASGILTQLNSSLSKLSDKNPGKFKKSMMWIITMTNEAANWSSKLLDGVDSPQIKAILHDILEQTKTWILHKPRCNKKEIKACNELMKVNWSHREFNRTWQYGIREAVEENMEDEWNGKDTGFMKYYLSEFEPKQFCAGLSTLLEKRASKCVWDAFTENKPSDLQTWFSLLNCLPGRGARPNVFADMFMKEFQKYKHEGSPDTHFKMAALEFLAKSPLALKFYQLLHKNSSVMENFPEDVRECVIKVQNVTENLLDSLSTASVTRGELDILWNHKEKMSELLAYFESLKRKKTEKKPQKDSYFPYVIGLLQKKWAEYNRECETIKCFMDICSTLEDQESVKVYYTPKLKNMLERDPHMLKISDLHKDFPESGVMDQISEVASLKDSHVFSHIFKKNAKTARKQEKWHKVSEEGMCKMPYKKVLKLIWNSTRTELLEVIHTIHEETIGQDEIIKTFGFSKGIITELHVELLCLYTFYFQTKHKTDVSASPPENPKKKDITELVTFTAARICSIFDLQTSKEILEWISTFKDKNALKANFKDLERLQSFKDIDTDLVQQFLKAVHMTHDRLEVLKDFSAQQALIDWLQEKMEDEDGVRVLCAMAMESTREVPLHMDRWSCLSDGVFGFEPLIFHLDEITGTQDLIKKCERIWDAVERDKKLIEKWTDAGKNVEWYKENERLYGADEKTSLKYARDVNERGVYTIGYLNEGQKSEDTELFENGDFDEIDLNSCVCLKLKDSDDKADLNRLHETESKLMLIAGDEQDGQKDVHHFVNLLKAVESLAQSFVNLIKAGCMLFSNWTAVIASARRQDSSGTFVEHELTISITFKSDIPQLSESTTLQDINEMSAIFRETSERWNDYVDKKRLKHYFLNDYNIQQIKYLCNKLAMIGKRPLPDNAYVLLSSEPRSSVTTLIQDSLKDAMQITEDEEEGDDSDEDMATGSSGSMDEKQLIIKKKKRAVRSLMKTDNVVETLAKAAVQAIEEESENIMDCSNWILLNEFDEKKVTEYSGKFDREVGFVHDQSKVQGITSILQNRSAMDLGTMISRLQSAAKTEGISLLESVKTICMGYLANTSILTLENYLSVEHLGRFLTKFRQYESDQKSDGKLQRSFRKTSPLKKGCPNFILCPEQDILSAVLSLYLRDENEMTAPLPTLSEVLVCCEDTTKDEVERFMRRAMCKYPGMDQLLFCLVFADKLSFNVCEATDAIFKRLSKEHANDDYLLVILSSDQQHHLSNCFDKYLVEALGFDETKISDYLAHHFQKSTADQDGAIVKIVTSDRSGVGKSLYIKRIIEGLEQPRHVVTVRLLEKHINNGHVLYRLYKAKGVCNDEEHFVHIDLSPAVERGIDKFMFDLLILGGIQDNAGRLWRRQHKHFYAVEWTNRSQVQAGGILSMLPNIRCLPPSEVLTRLQAPGSLSNEVLMDKEECLSETFQRPYQYLKRYKNDQTLFGFKFLTAEGDAKECLSTLLADCGMKNPSWAQLKHFASFLNVQLKSCEESVFCRMSDKELRFTEFTVKFMIRMSQDFATPSLKITDVSPKDSTGNSDSEADDNHDGGEFDAHQMRRTWEETDHPYIFFNEDRVSMTFINVHISKEGHLLDKKGDIVERNIAHKKLVQWLRIQGVSLCHDFHMLSRKKMLEKLRTVMGITVCNEPDSTYELTTENVLKILAIHMRFRCQIPVIIMGETGCGKTRMVEFMSKLKSGFKEKPKRGQMDEGPGVKDGEIDGGISNEAEKTEDYQDGPKNMITLKIHGGVGVKDIKNGVEAAKSIASENMRQHHLSTVLFFDEANTTTAIHAIKEVICDCTIDGESFEDSKLQIVAACNPYKKLSQQAMDSLESAGLGYRVKTNETSEKLGSIPMRKLVYRVVALPPSMQPFVWDFGQLGDEAELIYIQQMTCRLQIELPFPEDVTAAAVSQSLPIFSKDKDIIDQVLSCAQKYMRNQHNECRYVSLRDVERAISIFKWFYQHRACLFWNINEELRKTCHEEAPVITDVIRCLLQAVGISYHVSLEKRKQFREALSHALDGKGIRISQWQINQELVACQTVFLRDLKIADNIALNEAFRENVFLMTVCSDMKLPLFIVGKPGSSKSLAKAIIETNMKGTSSSSDLYRNFKKVQTFSYQCSALTEASGILKMFKAASERQKFKAASDRQKDQADVLNDFSAVVVLDEIGLAEDSPHMPLKVLHPLLECGSTTSGTLTDIDPVKKVGFIGISNWALDPAKMNRGIFVCRNIPSEDDLITTARGIFHDMAGQANQHRSTLESLTKTYLKVYEEQRDQYFGLRDYYSLIKMVRERCKRMTTRASQNEEIRYTLLRNFSGGSTHHQQVLNGAVSEHLKHLPEDWSRGITLTRMVHDSITDGDGRYLMLLTNQHSSVALLQYIIPDFDDAQVIFGSSFRGDHTYTEICKNINRIKICMERGRAAILLNLSEIHESLYDVLNQHYSVFGGQKYVTLGLGGHRLWSRVSEKFRIIVVEKKEIAHTEYPIPLVNRLEKHDLLCQNLLDDEQGKVSQELQEWVKKFSRSEKFSEHDACIGYHDDSVSSIVLACGVGGKMEKCIKEILQWTCADAVFRLPKPGFSKEEVNKILQIYCEKQAHDSLLSLLGHMMQHAVAKISVLEVISFSNILTEDNRSNIETRLDLEPNSVMLLSLQQFELEQEYMDKLAEFLKRCQKKPVREILLRTDVGDEKRAKKACNSAILLIQVSQAHKHGQLTECAKHSLMNRLSEIQAEKLTVDRIIIAFLLSTERHMQVDGTAGDLIIQHTKDSKVIYVDELRHTSEGRNTSLISTFYSNTFGDILKKGISDLTHHKGLDVYIVQLIRDCVCESMSKIKGAVNDRHLKRIEILTALCSGSSIAEEVRNGFQRVLLKKMVKLYENAQPDATDWRSWITTEAMSPERLQEGGTFGKTLHLNLKQILADLLAFIVSIIDENNNLDIIFHPQEDAKWKIDLWLRLFDVNGMQIDTMQGVREYSIQFPQHSDGNSSCQFPFSFVLNKMYNNMLTFDACKAAGIEVFARMAVKNAEHQTVMQDWHPSTYFNMMEAYAHDVIMFLFEPGTESQLEAKTLVQILFESSKQKWISFKREIDGITITFLTYIEILEHLKMISGICRVCPVVPKFDSRTAVEQEQETEFKVHEYALSDMLDWANKEASEIETEQSCIKWMVTSNKIKNVFYTHHGLIKADRRSELEEKWKPLSLLDLFLMNLLPGSNTDTAFSNYVRVIVSQAKRLLNAMRTLGLHSKSFLKIITNVLRRCYINVRLNLLISWRSPDCRQCTKQIQIPVILPCGQHYLCNTCVGNIVSSEADKQCPVCLEKFPETFEPGPAELSQAQTKEMTTFRANCTSFFLEYLDQFCFTAPSGEAYNEQVKRLFHDFLVDAESKSREYPDRLETEALDLNLATRSNIFQLLYTQTMKHKSRFVTEEVNRLLEELQPPQLNRFITSIMKGLEDQLIMNKSEKDPYEYSEETLRKSLQNLKKCGDRISLEMLTCIAGIRFALVNAVDCVQEAREAKNQESEVAHRLQLAAIDVCEKDKDIAGRFFVKVGLQVYGREWLNHINEDKKMKDIIPHYIMPLLKDEKIDFWVLLGEDYIDSKLALENSPTGLTQLFSKWFPSKKEISPLDVLPKIFAVEMCKDGAKGRNAKRLLLAKIGSIHESIFKKSNGITAALKVVQGISTYESQAIYYLAMTVCSTVLCKPYLMEELSDLITKPQEVAALYWPAMPELRYMMVADVLVTDILVDEAPYQCPNGHTYFIGECTFPWEVSACPVDGCGAPIGGRGHRAAAGNRRLTANDRSGYQLSSKRKGTDDPSDRVSRHGAAVIQFMIHSCMLAGYQQEPQQVSRMMEGKGVEFLLHKLKQNLMKMSEGLGRSTDDALLVFFEILNKMRQNGKIQNPSQTAPRWVSRQGRKDWEVQFRDIYLLPVFQNVDVHLLAARRNLTKARSQNHAALCKITNELETETAPAVISHSHPCLWKTIRYSKTAHLLQSIGDSSRPGKVLQIILQMPDLPLVQHLEGILKLQEMMIRRFQNQCDMKDVEAKTFKSVMITADYGLINLLKEYIGVWNKIYPLMSKKQEYKLTNGEFEDYIQPITEDSPISMALPSSRGRGKCAKILSEFLIDIQNEFLTACNEELKIAKSIAEVEVPKLQPSHFVCIDKQRDLLPLIHLHTSYEITEDEQGRHHGISYNIDALEKQAREKFVMYKKLIKKSSLPCIKYKQDIGIGSDWDQVRGNTPQEPLPAKIMLEVDEVIQQVTSADVCEGVRTLTHAISFLAKIAGEPSRKLREYLENDLKLLPSHMAMIPRTTLICHTLALYARLTWYKSVNFVRLGLDPYKEALYEVKQEKISDQTLKTLQDAFQHMDVTALQQHLNEMLIKVPDYKADWRLMEIFPFLEFIEANPNDDWYNRIPEEICYKHVSDLFRLSVHGI